jgi:glycosyltransferase involved in cell wall biosynthesis
MVHAHSDFFCGQPAARVAAARRIPFVYEVRGFWEDAATAVGKFARRSLRYRYIQRNENWVLKWADRVVAISRGLKDEIVSRGVREENVFLVPNGVDTDRFSPQPADLELSRRLGVLNRKVIGFIGSVVEWEGLDLVVTTIHQLRRKIPDLCFLIVGDGSAKAALVDLIDKQGVGEYVKWVGSVPPSDVIQYYTICDVLLYPRNRNRQNEQVTPLKPLEALAMEKAVLASDVGGLRELIIDGETGLNFRAGDGDDFVRQCVRLLTNEGLRKELGQRGRSWAVRNRDWRQIISLYYQVYEGLRAAPGVG